MKLKCLFLMLVCSKAVVDALLDKCPPLESATCSCTILYGPAVTCSGIKDGNNLDSSLRSLKGYAIDDFTLSDAELPSLAIDAFQGLHINRLILEKLEMTSSDILEFKGLEKTTKILEINNSFNRKKPMKGLKLDSLESLEAMMMYDNKISEITNDWFSSGPKTLSTVLLERNGIKSLGDKAFHSLDSLQILWLTNNPLSKLSRSMFPSSATVLEKIDLSNNKIKQLPDDLFSEMPQLVYINLANNLLHTFAEGTTALKNVRIHLEGNPFMCDDNLSWICKSLESFNAKTATCDVPAKMKGYSLKVFCDIKTAGH